MEFTGSGAGFKEGLLGFKAASGSPEREKELLEKIGELTVERDFLARGLARHR